MGATIRTVNRKDNNSTNPWSQGYLEFPKERDGVIYVRQSSAAQVLKNIHSFEMQTDKFLEHFRNMGCTGHIEVIADDEAMSGTLDIHELAGLTRVMKMIEEEKIGWVGAVAVNRLTRDPWLVKPGTIMKECYKHNVWIVTLRMQFNFKDDYSQRVFMLEAEEAARHLEWMKLILGGGKRTASDNGYYDGRPLSFGYIVDRTDPKKKKYIIYRPHAEMVFWLFKRFFELDGNFPALCKEVDSMPYLFPPFEPGIDIKGFRRFKRRKELYPEIGFKPSADGLIGILTNPLYIGWWIPLDGGLIENHHEPIVDEWLFTYAHKRLSAYDLKGQRQKPERITRNGEAQGILKKVAFAPSGHPVYAYSQNERKDGWERTETYTYTENKALHNEHFFHLQIPVIDSAFLEKFFERLNSWEGCDDWQEKMEERLAAKQASQEERKKLIQKQINNAQRQREETMNILDDPDVPKTKQMKIDYAKKIAGLEGKIAQLHEDLHLPANEEQEDEVIQYQIYSLLPDLIEQWEFLTFEQRLRFVGALVRQAILSRPAPGWAKMEIEWKRNDWETDIAFIRIDTNGGAWTQAEEELLGKLYPTATAMEILQTFPTRTWRAIKVKAWRIGVDARRKKGDENKSAGIYDFWDTCYNDVVIAEQYGLVLNEKNPQWYRQSPPPACC